MGYRKATPMRSKFSITTTVKTKICQRCQSPFESYNNLAKYCETCRNADKHRNVGRNSRALPEIIVQVDTEGDGNGSIISASYGREDGSSGSIASADSVEILRWWMANLSGLYDGQRQIVGGFHFNYDTAVLAKFMDTKAGRLRLLHKAKSTGGLICNKANCKCSKPYHAYDRKATINNITDGGEGNIVTWDKETSIGMATTPRRRFYAEYRPNGWDYTGYTSLDIHDIGTAFTGGLEKVIETWQPKLTVEQREIITWGKAKRKDNLADEPIDKVCQYSEAECVAAARCVRLLIDTIADAAGVTIKANALFGSGSMASATFHTHKLPRSSYYAAQKRKQQSDQKQQREIIAFASDPEIDSISELTYFGGIIETPVVGIVRGLAHEEDLNSAYPAAMFNLPCMREGHGHWKTEISKGGLFNPAKYKLTEHTVGHVFARWHVNTPSTPPFMVRDWEGNVYQPLQGDRTWVTMPEYIAALKQFPRSRAGGVWGFEAKWWVQTCNCPAPFAWIAELFLKRLAIKEQMEGHDSESDEYQHLNCHQEAIKLVMNSCYGKLAQRRPVVGSYTNMHYASQITGATRAKVRERTWLRESAKSIVIYQHTDSVLSIGKKPLASQVGEELGAWGLETKEWKLTYDAFLLQPGLMTGLIGGKTASRGVNGKTFQDRALEYSQTHNLRRHPNEWEPLNIPVRRMLGRKAAIVLRRKPHLAGMFIDNNDYQVKISRFKRDLDNATPIRGYPEAWAVPPVEYIETVTLDQLRKVPELYEVDDGSGDFDDDFIAVLEGEIDYDVETD
jgi:hypothetical protein